MWIFFSVLLSRYSFNLFCLFPRAMFLAPTLGLVRAQEAPQQISSGFSCGPDIKGARREEGNSRGAGTRDSKHWHRCVRGESRTLNKAKQELWRTKSHRNRRAVETDCLTEAEQRGSEWMATGYSDKTKVKYCLCSYISFLTLPCLP